MNFYWEKVEEGVYYLYTDISESPFGKVYWCDKCGVYHFYSDFFNFENDYCKDELELGGEDELLYTIKNDLIENVKIKIHLMTEWLGALSDL